MNDDTLPDPRRPLEQVCVYCASSRRIHEEFLAAARQLGRVLAEAGVAVVYGGGAVGSMGSLADGVMAAGGHVIGIIPRFMEELEWSHTEITKLHVVETMHERKERMLSLADAAIALPGGSGTFEELFEAITWKRLGLYLRPIVLVNTRGYFDPCIELLELCVTEHFMNESHRDMWQVVDRPEEVIDAIRAAPDWRPDFKGFAVP